jgi:hypothetical protein
MHQKTGSSPAFYLEVLLANFNNLYLGKRLPVAELDFVSFLGFEFDAGYFFALGGFQDLAFDFGPSYQRRADFDVFLIAQKQHFGESNFGADFPFQFFDFNFIPLGNFILFSARLDDCQHNVIFDLRFKLLDLRLKTALRAASDYSSNIAGLSGNVKYWTWAFHYSRGNVKFKIFIYCSITLL